MDSLIGKKIGPYQILEEIGRGGLAVLYKAYQPSLGRYVAIKVLPPYFQHDTEFLRRFLGEARRAVSLRHPSIVATYDAGQAGGYYYIAMEYMSGSSLASRLRTQGRLSLEDATIVVSQIAAALDYAHDQGLIHRDVKPSNILFDQSGQAKLADFGIAEAANQATVTLPGTLVGTPEYMSPEQGRGQQVDERTDIWSLGVVLYQMLTGRLPFVGDNPHAVLYQVVRQRPRPASSLNPNLPKAVDGILDKALQKSPRRRYRRAGEMAGALRQVVHRPTGMPTVLKAEVEPATKALERSALPGASPLSSVLWAIIGGLGALLLVVAMMFGIGSLGRAPTAPTPWETAAALQPTATIPSTVTIVRSAPTPMPSTPTSAPPTLESQPPTSTVRPTSTLAPPATTAIAHLAPALLGPPDGVELESGSIMLQWEWPGQLGPDEYFEVRVWREGEPHVGIILSKNTEHLLSLSFLSPGKYYWAIAVIRERDGKVEQLSPESEVHTFAWTGSLVTPTPR